MDFVIDFVYVGDGDAIIIWAHDPSKRYKAYTEDVNFWNGAFKLLSPSSGINLSRD